jgi:hypothetical protein
LPWYLRDYSRTGLLRPDGGDVRTHHYYQREPETGDRRELRSGVPAGVLERW